MITLGIVAIVAVVLLDRAPRLRPRRRHEPRALGLLPPAPPEFPDQLMYGLATIRGTCTRCGGPREACATLCAKRLPRPEPTSMPVAGPGARCSR